MPEPPASSPQRPKVRCFRVSEQEDREIRAEAIRRGLTLTDYLRSLVLTDRQAQES